MKKGVCKNRKRIQEKKDGANVRRKKKNSDIPTKGEVNVHRREMR